MFGRYIRRGRGARLVSPSAPERNDASVHDAGQCPIVLDALPSCMTIADAMREQSNVQRRLDLLQARVMANSCSAPGTQPLTHPSRHLEEVALLLPRLHLLKSAILHSTHSILEPRIGEWDEATDFTESDEQMRLVDLILRRDEIANLLAVMKKFTDNVDALHSAMTPANVKCTLNVPYHLYLAQQEQLEKQHQNFDKRIQYLNSRTRITWPIRTYKEEITLVLSKPDLPHQTNDEVEEIDPIEVLSSSPASDVDE